jgi:TrkA-C domain
MIAIISLLLIITVSILVTRIASIALTHTGLSRESARFQARSAFTGAGFTTSESERVVSHPVRRRIVMLLMLLGNAGIVTAMSSLILTFVQDDEAVSLGPKIIFLISGVTGLWILANSQWVDRKLSRLIEWALTRYAALDIKDYASLLHLEGDYRLVEFQVQAHDWLSHKTLAESRLRDEGIVALGIQRKDGTFFGAPKGHRRILPNDTLLLYGRIGMLQNLDNRKQDRDGDSEHQKAVASHKEVSQKEDRADKEENTNFSLPT